MSNTYRWFGLITAANIESITILVGSWLIGRWLDEHHSIPKISWIIIFIILGILMIVRTWIRVFKEIVK